MADISDVQYTQSDFSLEKIAAITSSTEVPAFRPSSKVFSFKFSQNALFKFVICEMIKKIMY